MMKSLALPAIMATCIAVVAPATAAEPQPEAMPFGSAGPVSGAVLGAVTGRADTAMEIRAQNSSTVSNNNVIGESTTGGISFDPQALQNLSGLSVLSANTGNNVSINSSLNLNVAIRP